MPGQDRTGPLGRGSRTGRGMGQCNFDSVSKNGQAGFGRGFNRGFAGNRGRGMGAMNRRGNFLEVDRQSVSTEKEDLKKYIGDLEVELKEAKQTLNDISDSKGKKDDK